MKTYLDYSASTPLDERVLEAMLPYFTDRFANPSSIHMFGQKAEKALEQSRESIANILNCNPGDLIFTSGGTESDNLALRGVAMAARRETGKTHILAGPVEHEAVSSTGEQLADLFGFDFEYLEVDEFGMVHPAELEGKIRPETCIVSAIYGNNEIGTINPLSEIGEVCRKHHVPFHTDAVQAGAYLSLDVQALKVDLMSIGAHKFYGPKGVGALYVRPGVPLVTTQTGGSHEKGRRAGTANVPYIVGMAKALEISHNEIAEHNKRLSKLRDQLIEGVLENNPDVKLTGHPEIRLPHHASFAFRNVDGNELLMNLDVAGFACSSGSACKTGLPEPSLTLERLGLTGEWTMGGLRVTLGRATNRKEIQAFLNALPAALAQAAIQTAPF